MTSKGRARGRGMTPEQPVRPGGGVSIKHEFHSCEAWWLVYRVLSEVPQYGDFRIWCI